MPELALRLCQPVHASSVRFMGHYNKIPDERLGFHRFFLLRVNGNLLAVLTQALETNNALNLGEQGVVLAAADVQARMDLRAALTDKDVAVSYTHLDVYKRQDFIPRMLYNLV